MDYDDIELIYELDLHDDVAGDELDDAWFDATEDDLLAHASAPSPVRSHVPVVVIVACAFVLAAVGATVL